MHRLMDLVSHASHLMVQRASSHPTTKGSSLNDCDSQSISQYKTTDLPPEKALRSKTPQPMEDHLDQLVYDNTFTNIIAYTLTPIRCILSCFDFIDNM